MSAIITPPLEDLLRTQYCKQSISSSLLSAWHSLATELIPCLLLNFYLYFGIKVFQIQKKIQI